MKTIQFADPGRGIKQATVRRWLKLQGQAVKAGEVLVELDAENNLIHVTAKTAGMLAKTTVEPGTTITVGTTLGELDETQVGSNANASVNDIPTHEHQEAAMPTESANTPQPSNTSPAAVPAGIESIVMPQAGNSMEEGTILSWKVKVGDTINEGDILCEIETDKATMEYESPVSGKLVKIVAAEDEIVAVKEPIAYYASVDMDTASLDLSGLGGGAATGEAQQSAASSASGGDVSGVEPIVMPQAGNSMEEGTILSWRMKEGDTVKEGDILCEIETDKATMEYESPASGRLAKIITQEGETLAVKLPIALLADNDADAQAWLDANGTGGAPSASPTPAAKPAAKPAVAKSSAKPAPAKPAAPVQPAATTGTGRIKASPAARRMAVERHLDLASVGQGSGPGGRILSTDLDKAKAAGGSSAAPSIAPLQSNIGEAAQAGQPIAHTVTKMRKAIASNLVWSKQNVPHFYIRMTIDADPMFRFYRENKPKFGCTVNDVVLLAVGKTLAEFPTMRTRWEDGSLVEYPASHVGVAVGVEDGLVVPVAMGVDAMDLGTLASETKRIVGNARNGNVENMGKGVFTITNLGMFGVEDFMGIINPPESGILAISAVREEVIVKDGAMRAGRVMTMTLSADHRVVDGMQAAQYMKRLVEVLEHPQLLA